MEKKCAYERLAIANSTEKSVEMHEVEEEDDDEEALSLSDLPLIHQSRKDEDEDEEREKIGKLREKDEMQDDFDFCSFSKESEMCTADEVFFQGQILPFRHSIGSEKASLQYPARYISRSGSMDHNYSGRLLSSRSSSISSGSSSATASSGGHRPRFPPRNPSPGLHLPTYKQGICTSNQRHSVQKSSIWSILRLGLVTAPPEIAFRGLKTRKSANSRNFGSRNSTSSNYSSVSINSSKKKKKKAIDFLGGCNCTSAAVDTVTSRVVIIRRSASESNVEEAERLQLRLPQENVEDIKVKPTKKHVSHHRTFEWLKQLSVEGTADES